MAQVVEALAGVFPNFDVILDLIEQKRIQEKTRSELLNILAYSGKITRNGEILPEFYPILPLNIERVSNQELVEVILQDSEYRKYLESDPRNLSEFISVFSPDSHFSLQSIEKVLTWFLRFPRQVRNIHSSQIHRGFAWSVRKLVNNQNRYLEVLKIFIASGYKPEGSLYQTCFDSKAWLIGSFLLDLPDFEPSKGFIKKGKDVLRNEMQLRVESA